MSCVTFSRNVFIPLTNICRNRCKYCGFRREIDDPGASLLSPDEVSGILLSGKQAGCSEALFTFGERPEEVQGFRSWLKGYGYDNIIDYLVELCRTSIETGLLPHSNPGVLEKKELEKLGPYNASMGLMLETTVDIVAHEGCVGKVPEARIRTIEYAGELGIPFTTGILIGIGETPGERIESLNVIRDIHEEHGHIQEVIIQNFIPKKGTEMGSFPAPGITDMVETVKIARKVLPDDVTVQVPPNLVDPGELIRCGACDLGGISPVTIDHINPEEAWPEIEDLKKRVPFTLRERLPIYPVYVKKKMYSKEISSLVTRLADEEGFRKQYL